MRDGRAAGANLERFRGFIRDGWSPPVALLIGFRLIRVEPEEATFVLDAGPQHANPMGTMHGGILCDLADAAMGVAYATGISPSEGFTTVELKANFLRPVWTGRLTAVGKVMHRGRTMGLTDCRITDAAGKLVAYATSTCLTIPGGAGDGLVRPERAAGAGGSG